MKSMQENADAAGRLTQSAHMGTVSLAWNPVVEGKRRFTVEFSIYVASLAWDETRSLWLFEVRGSLGVALHREAVLGDEDGDAYEAALDHATAELVEWSLGNKGIGQPAVRFINPKFKSLTMQEMS